MQNARKYGVSISSRYEDYYNTVLHDDSSSDWVQLGERNSEHTYTLIYNGQEMEGYCRYVDTEWSKMNWTEGENYGYTYTATAEYQVPVGYDGAVFGVFDKSIDLDDAEWYIHERYSPEDFLLFRLD